MFQESYLPIAVVKPRLVQILTHLDSHVAASLVITALDYLPERAATKLLQSLIPKGQMVAIHRLIEASLSVIAVIL